MSLPGPSSLGRIAACPTSETLQHVHSTSKASEWGLVKHAFLAACVNVGRDAALLQAPLEYREMLELIPAERLPPLDPKHHAAEVSFALILKTGECRELGRDLGREAARALAHEDEMVGTADLVGLTADTAVIYDWKGGRGHVDRADVNWQVKTYCLMAARTYGRENARGSIVRVLDDGTVWYDTVEMDSLDLDAHEAELRDLMAKREHVLATPANQRPALHEGEHCRYCPALPFCPAKVYLLQSAFQEAPLEAEAVELSPERAARAWATLDAVEKLVERLRAVVKDYARQYPFATGDGWVVGEVTDHKEAIVADRARKALEAHLGPQLGGAVYSEVAETKVSVAKSKLKTALSRLVLPTLPKEKAKITHVERETLEALRKAGAISVASYVHVKEHKAPEAPKEKKALPPPPKAEKEPEWNDLSLDARIDFGLGKGTVAELYAAEADKRAARDARIRSCEEGGGHQWGRMGRCLNCNAPQIDRSSGHPVHNGVRVCTCVNLDVPCVDATAAAEGVSP